MDTMDAWVYCCDNKLHIPKQRCFSWAQVMCVLFSLAKTENCPASCTCIENTVTATCSNSNMIEVPLPTDLPEWIHTLIVSGNNIPSLIGGAFSSNGTDLKLLTLSLSDNNIQTIEAYAFLGLPRLRTLDLSKNQLGSISLHAFFGLYELRDLCLNDTLNFAGLQLSNALSTESLRNLRRLELSGNKLKGIPITKLNSHNLIAIVLTNNSFHTIGKEHISQFSEHKNLQVFLASNPFECNCELGTLYYWLKNSSQCPDATRLLCSEPAGKHGLPVIRLKKEDLDCKSVDLETVSYVLLGIVLAVIGVVFLMVLYLNRKGIKRWLNNIREACRDHMQLYYYRYEQDSDPRLASVAV